MHHTGHIFAPLLVGYVGMEGNKLVEAQVADGTPCQNVSEAHGEPGSGRRMTGVMEDYYALGR